MIENHRIEYKQKLTDRLEITSAGGLSCSKKEQLVDRLNLSRATITRYIKQLKDKNFLKRVGSDKSGYWEFWMLNKLKPKSKFSRNVLTLMTGTTIAQAIPISPILTRIYTPDDFGVFSLFVAITSILSVIVIGQYYLSPKF